jgi:hypothetical protein
MFEALIASTFTCGPSQGDKLFSQAPTELELPFLKPEVDFIAGRSRGAAVSGFS